MISMSRCVLTVLVGCLLAGTLPAKAADWWDQRWEARMAIEVPARTGMLKQWPVDISKISEDFELQCKQTYGSERL